MATELYDWFGSMSLHLCIMYIQAAVINPSILFIGLQRQFEWLTNKL